MRRTLTLSVLLIVLGACSEDPASKYANAEECAFKESKDCEDKSCASLAYSYCEKSFEEIKASKIALYKTCKEYKARAVSCPRSCYEPKEPKHDGFDVTYYRYELCMDGAKEDCSENAISKRNKFIKSKCN